MTAMVTVINYHSINIIIYIMKYDIITRSKNRGRIPTTKPPCRCATDICNINIILFVLILYCCYRYR